jgi:putative addiction module component (TIGR02574 family)
MTFSLPADIAKLSLTEKIQLVEDLWDSILQESAEIPLTPVQKAELDRRLEAHQQDPHAVSSWEEVKKRFL